MIGKNVLPGEKIMSNNPETPDEIAEPESTLDKAKKLTKKGLLEINRDELAKNGGQNLMDKYVELFKTVQEQQFSIKKLQENEIIMGTILEGQIRNSILYPDNYQMMLKCVNVYQLRPAGVPDHVELDPSELIIEERREIVYIARAGCTQILRQLKIPEPDNELGYDLKALAQEKNALNKLRNRRYILKYMGLKEFERKQFNSYVIKLL